MATKHQETNYETYEWNICMDCPVASHFSPKKRTCLCNLVGTRTRCPRECKEYNKMVRDQCGDILFDEGTMRTFFTCCNCGHPIRNSAINYPCPNCGWPGSKYLEHEKRLINQKQTKRKKEARQK